MFHTCVSRMMTASPLSLKMGEPQPPPWLLGCCWQHDGHLETAIQVSGRDGAVLSRSELHGTRWCFASELESVENERAGDQELLTAALKAEAGGGSASPVLKTRCSKSRGRYVVLEGTGGALSVGTPVMHCQASAAVVADQSLASTCHACFQPLKGKALRCGGCMTAHYCCRSCLDEDEALHELVCERVGRVTREAASSSSRPGGEDQQQQSSSLLPGEAELARLALDVMARCFMAFKQGGAAPLLTELKELVSHAEHVPAHVVEGVARLADLIIARPSSSSSSPGSPPSAEEQSPGDLLTSLWDRRELAELLLKLRFNCHPATLGVGGSRLLGLFPPATAFNHSCAPNLAISFTATDSPPAQQQQQQQEGPPLWLQLRCVRGVVAGEEVSYSYLSGLHQPLAERRALLRSSFLFTCRCQRCRHEEQQGSDGLVCPNCGGAAVLKQQQPQGKEGSMVVECCRQCCSGERAGPWWWPAVTAEAQAVIVAARKAAAKAVGAKTAMVLPRQEAESAAEALLQWLGSSPRVRCLGPAHGLRSEAATLLLALGQAVGHQEAVATGTGMLDELLWVKGLACVPQRADLLRLRARALAAIAAAGQAGGRAEQLAAHLSQQAGRVAAAIYALSLGPEHPMSRGAGRAAEGSASSTTTTAGQRREGRPE